MRTTHHSFCRFCHAFCGIKVDIEDGRVVKVIGDIDNPMYFGFSCSKGRALPEQHNRPERLLHPAFMHPDDLAEEGFQRGDVIEIDSGHASILGVVEPAADVKRRVISMAHSWGDAPKYDADVRTIGSNTGRLSPNDRDYDPITGIPVMSAIPVNVRLSDLSYDAVH